LLIRGGASTTDGLVERLIDRGWIEALIELPAGSVLSASIFSRALDGFAKRPGGDAPGTDELFAQLARKILRGGRCLPPRELLGPAKHGLLKTLEVFLEAGYDPFSKFGEDGSALEVAHEPVRAYLLSRRARDHVREHLAARPGLA
jgi:hypothetical protein